MRKRTGRLTLLLSIVLALGLPVSTLAGPSRSEVEQFKKYVANGAEAFGNDNYRKALDWFRKAEKIAQPPSLQYNIGRTLQSLHRCSAARETFEAYLEHDLSNDKLEKGKKRLEQVENSCTPLGILSVECAPEDADAVVRLEEVTAECPAKLEVETGRRDVEVAADGYESSQFQIRIEAGKESKERVRLQPAEPTPRSKTGGGSGPGWSGYGKLAGLAGGVSLIAAGVATDLAARRRLRKMRDAKREGDRGRVLRLQDEAKGSNARGIVFYAAGGALVAGTVTWIALDGFRIFSMESSGSSAALALQPGGVEFSLAW